LQEFREHWQLEEGFDLLLRQALERLPIHFDASVLCELLVLVLGMSRNSRLHSFCS
jgi:hypothetical protein